MIKLSSIALPLLAVLASPLAAASVEQPGAPVVPYVDPNKAYLFLHMTKEHYGTLYYSVSLDGLYWHRINGGRPVSADYHGHASVAQGPDGRYYLVGNKGDDDPLIRFWVSDDLITWTPFGTYQPDLHGIAGMDHALQRIGAPKLFFDKPSGKFLLSWHTPTVEGVAEDPERYWASQRTLYVQSPDLKTFADKPRRLLGWNMATIDTIVRPNDDGGYCVIIKDERYPSTEWTTGKTVRISCAKSLLGPYPLPGPSLSPNFREAPTLIRSPDDKAWFLYYEQYAGASYGVSTAPKLAGPWYQMSGNTTVKEWDRFSMPTGTRHGSMMQITRKQYDALVKAFPDDAGAKPGQ